MLFWQRMWPGLKDGSITLTFRRWKRPQVVAGRPYRVGVGRIRVDSVEVVDPEAIPDSEARKAGFDDAVELRASLVGDGALDVYRVAFEFLTEQDPGTPWPAGPSCPTTSWPTSAPGWPAWTRRPPRATAPGP